MRITAVLLFLVFAANDTHGQATTESPRLLDSIPQVARDVTALLLPWALEGHTLPGADHNAGLAFPDRTCVKTFLDHNPSTIIFVSWRGTGIDAGAEAVWKWLPQEAILEVLAPAERKQFESHVRPAAYVPGPWFLITAHQSPDGVIDLTYRYGHSAGSMLVRYVYVSLQLMARVFL